jgi:hypothetical protein
MLEKCKLQRKCCENLKSHKDWKGLGLSPMAFIYGKYEYLPLIGRGIFLTEN